VAAREMQRTGVSVVIPTYNGEPFLRETIRSVFAQSRLPEEVIVVDDASIDGTVEAVQEYCANAPTCVRLIRLERNSGGPATPLNVGIEAAQGEFVALLDQDDLMLPEKLAMQSDVLETNDDVELVLSDHLVFDQAGIVPGSDARHKFAEAHELVVRGEGSLHRVPPVDFMRALILEPALPISCSNQFFRKSAWRRIGGFRPCAGAVADYDFLVRLIRSPVAWLERVLFHKRRHGSNLYAPSAENTVHLAHAQCLATRRFSDDVAFRRLAAEHVWKRTQELRWFYRQYGASLRIAHELFWLGEPRAAAIEAAKSLASMLRDRFSAGSRLTRRL
jgi:glycosyltransferase involved in cell wall biosynthesis